MDVAQHMHCSAATTAVLGIHLESYKPSAMRWLAREAYSIPFFHVLYPTRHYSTAFLISTT